MKVMLVIMIIMTMMACELAVSRSGRTTGGLAHWHVTRSSTHVNVTTDKEWNSNVLKSDEVKCDVSIFANLKLSFLSGFPCFFFISVLLSLLWYITACVERGRWVG